MIECSHSLGIFYCIEVDPETSMDLGKVAFFVKAPLVITFCKQCNKVMDTVSTDPIQERMHTWNYRTSPPAC